MTGTVTHINRQFNEEGLQMSSCPIRASFALIALVIAAAQLARCNSAGAVELADNIRTALQANGDRLSPIRLAWTEQRESHLSLKELSVKIRNTNGALLLPSSRLHMISGARFYHHAQYPVETDGVIDIQRQHTSFDGRKIIHASDDAGQPNWHEVETPARFVKMNKPGEWIFYTEYLTAAGLHIGNRVGDLFDSPKSIPLSLVEADGDLITVEQDRIEAEECVALTIWDDDIVHTYWLSPRMGYAVIRSQQSGRDGRLLRHVRNDDFKMLSDPSLWLPRKVVVDYYQWHSTPSTVFEMIAGSLCAT